MSRIRGKDTTPEKLVRSMLHKMGYRFRLHVRIPTGGTRSVSVDILLPKYKTAIFVHGCFWHRHKGCKNCTTPTHRREWWLAKLNGNAERDKLNQRALKKLGWRVIVIWECEANADKTIQRIAKSLQLTPKDFRPV